MTHSQITASPSTFVFRDAAVFVYFFFNDTATTEIYTLSLHDALPDLNGAPGARTQVHSDSRAFVELDVQGAQMRIGDIRDRKSTRLNSSHSHISYAVFCLNKKTYHRARWPSAKHATARLYG